MGAGAGAAVRRPDQAPPLRGAAASAREAGAVTVPDRAGEYPAGALGYVGTNDCTNPLFAASLPDGSGLSANVATAETPADATALCKLPASSARPANRVLFAIIGGVPWQLLHFDPNSPQG